MSAPLSTFSSGSVFSGTGRLGGGGDLGRCCEYATDVPTDVTNEYESFLAPWPYVLDSKWWVVYDADLDLDVGRSGDPLADCVKTPVPKMSGLLS